MDYKFGAWIPVIERLPESRHLRKFSSTGKSVRWKNAGRRWKNRRQSNRGSMRISIMVRRTGGKKEKTYAKKNYRKKDITEVF